MTEILRASERTGACPAANALPHKHFNSAHFSRSEHVSGAERWEFTLPAHVGVRSPAPPLKVGPDRSAQFRFPLIYNFIPLRWDRSTLAQI